MLTALDRFMRGLALVFVMSVAFARPAIAQLPLPQVQLPGVPLPGVTDATRGVGGALGDLATSRALRIQRMSREHRAELDRVNDELVVRAEVVAIDIKDAPLARALKESFRVSRTQDLVDLEIRITVLQTPAGWSAKRGLQRLRKLDPDGTYDYNHVYLDSGTGAAGSDGMSPTAGGTARIGLIDGGVDEAHRSLTRIRIHRFGCSGAAVPSTHGTAVASLAVRGSSIGELFAADVYCGAPTGGAVDAVAAAFGWMAREHVAVINVSLVGPRNALLERVVQTLVRRGHVIVAAVGNDGPAAPILFPAGYDGVVGVTAVDAKHRVLIEACRGKQVDFAAAGVDESAAASAPDSYAPVRGTSFAAPIVARLLAEKIGAPDPAQRQRALDELLGSATDLGAHGRDDVYGAGEVGAWGDAATPRP